MRTVPPSNAGVGVRKQPWPGARRPNQEVIKDPHLPFPVGVATKDRQ